MLNPRVEENNSKCYYNERNVYDFNERSINYHDSPHTSVHSLSKNIWQDDRNVSIVVFVTYRRRYHLNISIPITRWVGSLRSCYTRFMFLISAPITHWGHILSHNIFPGHILSLLILNSRYIFWLHLPCNWFKLSWTYTKCHYASTRRRNIFKLNFQCCFHPPLSNSVHHIDIMATSPKEIWLPWKL